MMRSQSFRLNYIWYYIDKSTCGTSINQSLLTMLCLYYIGYVVVCNLCSIS